MSDLTQILERMETGDPQASAELLPLVYEELRRLAKSRMANERPDHTLQATALVHEAYLQLVDGDHLHKWNSRGHFFGAAAEAMRRILINSAKSRQSLKRGGDLHRAPLEDVQLAIKGFDAAELIEFNELLELFAKEDPEAAELVKLRLFAGLSVSEAGEALGLSRSTAYGNWDYAKAWFGRKDLEPLSGHLA